MVAEGPVGRADGPDRLTLIVLGGGPAQRHAIEAAERLGVRPLVCDGSPGVGDAAVSSEDTEGVRRVARESGAAGLIAPGTDWPVRIAAYVAEELGLPHPLDVATAVRCTNKIAQREVLDAAGVPQPAWSLRARPGYPCVVKASDRQGQRAMTIVGSPDDLEQAAARARAAARGGRALFEAFVPGPEVTVNAFSVGGRFHPVAVTARDHFDGAPGVARRHVYPSGLDDEAAIGVARGGRRRARHQGRAKLRPADPVRAGPVIMEVAARLGGGHDSEICRLAAGVDLADAAVRAAVGWTVEEAAARAAPERRLRDRVPARRRSASWCLRPARRRPPSIMRRVTATDPCARRSTAPVT